jgi:hypothetical protein
VRETISTYTLSAILLASICDHAFVGGVYQITFFQFHEFSRTLIVVYVGVVREYALAVKRTLEYALVRLTNCHEDAVPLLSIFPQQWRVCRLGVCVPALCMCVLRIRRSNLEKRRKSEYSAWNIVKSGFCFVSSLHIPSTMTSTPTHGHPLALLHQHPRAPNHSPTKRVVSHART